MNERLSSLTAEIERKRSRGAAAWFLALAASVAVTFLAAIALGSVRIPLSEVVKALVGGAVQSETERTIVRDVRLPRACGAAMVGAALAVSGLLMQTLFRNPLAGPFVLGVDAGASLGVALVTLATGPGRLEAFGFLASAGRIAAGWTGAAAVLVVVLAVAKRLRDPVSLLIVGLLTGYVVSALVSILIAFSTSEQVAGYIAWTMGSFRGMTWPQLAVMTPALAIGFMIGALLVKPLDALLLGAEAARGLGVAVEPVRVGLVAAAAILAGTVTAFCGPIAFLGVAVPHLARGLLAAADHRRLMPAAALIGAELALVADIIARTPGRTEALPLSSVTALLGAPVLAWVVLRRGEAQG